MRHLAAVLPLVFAAAGPLHAAAPSLPFSQESDSEGYLIRFTNQGSHALPISQAQDAADALDRSGNDVPGNPKGHHDGFVDLDFLEPYFTGDKVVDFWNCKNDDDTPCDNGSANVERIRMPTSEYSVTQNPGDIMSTEMCMRMVLGHELFHHVEYAYVDEAGGSGCGPWGSAACEGMARMMQDQIYTDIDTAASSCISAQGQFNAYLGDTNRTLWELGYTAALFWKYLAEQYGNVTVEPERGADFIRRWWQNAVDDFDTPDVIQLTRETIQDFGGAGVDAAFHDFTIANLAKDFDLGPLTASEEARWSYVDSGQGFGQNEYAAIDGIFYPDVSPGDPYPFFTVVFDYGATYQGATVDQCPAGALLRFKVTPWIENMVALGVFGLLIRRDDEVIDVAKKVGTTWNYARTQSQLEYTHLAATFGALADVAWLEYEFRCSVDIQVDFPLIMRPKPTHGGPPDSFAVAEVDVLVLTSDPLQPVPGIDPVSFDIDLGEPGSKLRAPTLAALRTPLGYRLLYAPPEGLGTGAHRVAVGVGSGVADGTSSTFMIGEKIPATVVLLDRSQSMTTLVGGTSRFDLARRAARSAADGMRDGSQLGLVAFAGDGVEPNDDAIEAFDLTALDTTQRAGFAAALAALPAPSGPTSIGDGLAAAARMLAADAAPNQERHAVLLSDGAESEASSWPTVRAAVLESDVRVHAIALGQNADQGLLAEIATETRGSFQFVSETPAETLPTRLADAFARAADRAEGRQRLFESPTVLPTAGGIVVPIEIAEDDLDALRIRLDWDNAGSAVSATLRAPDGAVQMQFNPKEFTISKPVPAGTWELELSAPTTTPTRVAASARPGDGAYLVTSVSHGAGADTGTTGRTGGFDRHLPIVLEAAFLDASGPIADAVAEARIEHPDGSAETVALLDDGRDADQIEGDGIYSASYRRTTVAGQTGLSETAPGTRASYPVQFRLFKAEGTPVRHASESIWVGAVASADVEPDGLPDAWEALHLCVTVGVADGSLDPDGDELTNAQELEAGTDPCRSDTDGGGENDGSEIARGARPLDPGDDLLPAPGWLSVVNRIYELHVPDDPRFVPQPFANLLRVPSAPEYAQILIERRQTGTASPEPWVVIARPDPHTLGGAYLDDELPEGATFEYRMRGVDAAGNESALSKVVEATVKADPIAPIGSLRIEHGPRTDARSVDLGIDLYLDEPEEIEMLLASPAVRGGGYEAYAPQSSILLPEVDAPTSTVITATLRDAAGNESLTYAESILQYPEGSLGSIRGVAERAPTGSNDGVFVRLAGRADEVVVLSDTDGSFVLDDLLPGSYDVALSYHDLEGEATSVVVAAGAETDVGTVLVPEPGVVSAMVAALGALLALRRRYAGGSR